MIDIIFLARRTFEEECAKALFTMGLKKSPRWDGLIVEFFREFWQELQEQAFLIVKIEPFEMAG